MLTIKQTFDAEAMVNQAIGMLDAKNVLTDVSRAMNESMSKVRSQASRVARTRFMLLSAGMFTPKGQQANADLLAVTVRKAGPNSLSTSVKFSGRRLTLGRYAKTNITKFGAQRRSPAFGVLKDKSNNTIEGSFGIRNSSLPNRIRAANLGKGYQIAARVRGAAKKVPTKGRYAGKVYVKGPRKGQPYQRQPLEVFRNIAIAEMMNTRLQGSLSYSRLLPIFQERLTSRLEKSFRTASIAKAAPYRVSQSAFTDDV